LTTCRNLWDPNNILSLTNESGIVTWFTAAQLFQQNNFTLATTLMTTFGVSPQQIGLIFFWLSELEGTVIGPGVLAQFGVASFHELAYLQWGTSNVLLGQSAAAFDPTLPAPPEFGYYSFNTAHSPVVFNATFSERLLNGTVPFFSGDPIGQFLFLISVGDFATIGGIWGLSPPQAGVLAGYFTTFFANFVDTLLEYQIFPEGGGPITSRTPIEWLYTSQDPLLSLIGQDPHVGTFYVALEAPTRAAALNQTLRNQFIFRGGSLAERTASQEVKRYPDYPPGNKTIVGIWNDPVDVMGNYQGVYWPPNTHTDDVLTAWLDQLVRPIDFKYWKQDRIKGIDVYLYNAAPETWDANPLYFQADGFMNLSSSQPVNLFFSRVHFFGVPDDTIRNGVTGLESEDPAYGNLYFAVEPESGLAVFKLAPIQVNMLLPPMDRYYKGINATRMCPLFWINNQQEISDKDANSFKKQVGALKAGVIAAYVVGIILGALLAIAGIFVCINWNLRRHRAGEDANIEVELPSK